VTVASHLGLAAADYDAAIRRYIPAYDQMIASTVAVVGRLAAPYVVDLGTGTGALAAAILDGVPGSLVQLLDVDPAMLEVAAARVADHGVRAQLVRGSFDDALPSCNAIVASLALHHVTDRAAKATLYARIRDALRPGGVLVVADITVHEDGPEHALSYDLWTAAMGEHGIAADAARELYAKWAGPDGDRYFPLATELALLGDAGFPRPECFFKSGPTTVFGAFR
jgi:tRNA (cmo5U34)-methyltransferase